MSPLIITNFGGVSKLCSSISIFLIVLVTGTFAINGLKASVSFQSSNFSADIVDSLNAKAASFRFTNLDSMSVYADSAYSIATTIDHIPGLVEATRLKTVHIFVKGDYPEALELLFEKKLEIDDLDYVKERAIVDYYIGLVFNASGNYQAGLPYLLEAIDIFRSLDEESYVFQALNNIGVCYIRLEKYQEALDIFLEIEAAEHDSNPGLITTLYVNLAYCYYGIGEYDKAEETLLEFFDLPKESINERGYGFAYFKLGEVYYKQGLFPRAIEAFNSSIKTFESFESYNDTVEPLVGLTEVFQATGDIKEANKFAKLAVEASKRSGILLHQKKALNAYYDILKSDNKYKAALYIHEEYKAVVDSLVATQQTAAMGRLTAQYDFNQQRNELLLNQKQKELENQNVQNRQRLLIDISIIVIISVVILLALIYRSYTIKIKSNKLLAEKNKEIEQQKDSLEETNRIKNKLFSIISHDLRSPINTLNGLLYLVRNKMATKEDFETVMPKLIENFDHASNLLNNLLNWTTSQMEGYTLEFKNFDIKDVLEGVLDTCTHSLKEKSIEHSIVGESVVVHGEKNMIQIVCQNLVMNAVKFCEPGDSIELRIEALDKIRISIVDTGVGISPERVHTLLNESSFSSTQGTHNEKGSGLGLTICKDFLLKNNSELMIESTEKRGSSFYFYLPKGV